MDKPIPLTESRIKRILDVGRELTRRTKKDAKVFLQVPRVPDISRGETLVDVVAPQMAQYFSGLNEDPARYFQDRDRMMMIFYAIKAGGVRAHAERYRQLATGELLAQGIAKMKEKGFGNPGAVAAMLPQALKNAESQQRLMQTVEREEEQAVENCVKEIEQWLFRGRRRPATP
jgi:hypothetical protein